MILAIIMTDGRQHCFKKTIRSLIRNVSGFDHVLINDDSGSTSYSAWLATRYGAVDATIFSSHERSGFGGAIQNAWRESKKLKPDYIFHLEDDFTFNKPIDLAEMSKVLDDNPYLMQLALRRQPWNEQEKEAGGIVEANPYAFTEKTDGEHTWLEHREFFTTNPSLYRASLTQRGWPGGANSEGKFSIGLLSDHNAKCGYWGSKDSGEWVTHIGDERVGKDY